MGRHKRRRDFPDNPEDMTVEQLRDELAHWRKMVRLFEEQEQTRNRKECLKEVARIEKLLAEKAAKPI
jgi:hypothetical protein